MSRRIALSSGGDWSDATCNHICIPDDMDLIKEKKEYDIWYKKYCEDLRKDSKANFKTFTEFIKEKGAYDDLTIDEFYDE